MMINSPMMEAESGKMTINDKKLETVQGVVQFIYTGNCNMINEENAEDLFRAADQFLLQGMKKICEIFLVSNVSLENAVEMMALGHMYKADQLKKAAKNVILEAGTIIVINICVLKWS